MCSPETHTHIPEPAIPYERIPFWIRSDPVPVSRHTQSTDVNAIVYMLVYFRGKKPDSYSVKLHK